jgi:hypothetical protein
MNMKAVAVVAGVLVLALAPAASAQYPGERVANNPTLNELVAIGQNHWRTRVPPVTPCAHPTVMLADELTDSRDPAPPLGWVFARADWNGCTMWFKADAVSYLQSHPLDEVAALTAGTLVAHELGHTAGLQFPDNPLDPYHSPNPRSLMYADVANTVPLPTVRGLARWVHRRAAAARRGRYQRPPSSN